jgi:hypothetical protein
LPHEAIVDHPANHSHQLQASGVVQDMRTQISKSIQPAICSLIIGAIQEGMKTNTEIDANYKISHSMVHNIRFAMSKGLSTEPKARGRTCEQKLIIDEAALLNFGPPPL